MNFMLFNIQLAFLASVGLYIVEASCCGELISRKHNK